MDPLTSHGEISLELQHLQRCLLGIDAQTVKTSLRSLVVRQSTWIEPDGQRYLNLANRILFFFSTSLSQHMDQAAKATLAQKMQKVEIVKCLAALAQAFAYIPFTSQELIPKLACIKDFCCPHLFCNAVNAMRHILPEGVPTAKKVQAASILQFERCQKKHEVKILKALRQEAQVSIRACDDFLSYYDVKVGELQVVHQRAAGDRVEQIYCFVQKHFFCLPEVALRAVKKVVSAPYERQSLINRLIKDNPVLIKENYETILCDLVASLSHCGSAIDKKRIIRQFLAALTTKHLALHHILCRELVNEMEASEKEKIMQRINLAVMTRDAKITVAVRS